MQDDPQAWSRALRAADQDRFLSTLYASADLREPLSILYLFNAEIAAIRDRIHEALPGEIRIQWWRDALAGGVEGAGGHPLAGALAGVIDEYGLPLDAFDRYLEARIFDLYDDPMPTRGDLEGYCGETASAIIQLASLILEPEAAPAFASAAGHAGCAQAVTGILRLLPVHRARGQCYIPADILTSVGASRDIVLDGKDKPAGQRAIAAMVALAREHLQKFEKAAEGMPPTLRPAYLPAALSGIYLDRIAKSGFDAVSARADMSVFRRHVRLLRRAARGWG